MAGSPVVVASPESMERSTPIETRAMMQSSASPESSILVENSKPTDRAALPANSLSLEIPSPVDRPLSIESSVSSESPISTRVQVSTDVQTTPDIPPSAENLPSVAISVPVVEPSITDSPVVETPSTPQTLEQGPVSDSQAMLASMHASSQESSALMLGAAEEQVDMSLLTAIVTVEQSQAKTIQYASREDN
ncbi:uncharacterized protein ACLA_004160 [Aspergillus clavatus NRRL 1]|uniref:Uncharacterized protein n=1 Tax=Aspergillus clavatus (strain ATCC 1007 / CBS 513.65 / DSM 816 / NCTC 3887 / NRRL 1 / QM 1276 / 107) TaxID=344612 RepID=A1C5N4_ASPCL|nr:uncharacterized protein ACLA_004160 [Aspergillus clavatus NRRL 1]EAW15002.1 hypothetical protein ACLA_004160 [Aspergillus clavatus NRRL 1]